MENLPNHVQLKLQALYSDRFPIEVRFVLAEWLEGMSGWDDLDPDNPQHEDYVLTSLLPALFVELKKKTATSGMDIKFRLTLGLQKMEAAFAQDAMHLIRVVKQCLTEEANIVREYESVSRRARVTVCL